MAAIPMTSLRALNRAKLPLLPSRAIGQVATIGSGSQLPRSRASDILAISKAVQSRQQSTSARPRDAKDNKGKTSPPPPPPPPPSGLRLFLRLLNLRNIGSSLTPNGVKTLYRQSPVELVTALIILASLLGISGYIVKVCVEYFYARQFTKYPAPIAKSLRRALYYTNMSPDPTLARKWYKRALEQCDELGLDPYSDDVLGIRIQTAAWLEKIGNFPGAITVLESVLSDCTKWVAAMEKGMAEGKVDKSGKAVAPRKKEDKESKESKDDDDEEVLLENLWRKRNRLLAKAVGTSTKLGELYADDHVNDSENSQVRLTWAVETALKESRRRSTEGVKPEEGKWLTPEEFGGAMESTMTNLCIAARGQQMLTDPVNNLAAAFAQHPVIGSAEPTPDAPAAMGVLRAPGMPTTREGFLEAAWNWAKNARTHAKDVESSQRTPECDEACAVALSNMADIAAMRGNVDAARRKFQQCIELSNKIGFEQGVAQAQAGLRNLNTRKPSVAVST